MESNNSLTSFYYEPSILKSTGAATLVIAFLYIILGKLSFLIPINSSVVSPIFLPAGLALASVLVFGKKSLLGICIGAFYVNISYSFNAANINSSHLFTPILIGLFIALGATIAAFASKAIIIRISRGLHPFYSGETALIYLLLGPIVYSSISSLFGIIGLTLSKTISMNQIWHSLQTWWLGDVIGIILLTPFILSCISKDFSDKKKINASEMLLFGIILIISCYIVFFQQNDLKYLLLPLLYWSVYRFGTKITSLVIIVIAFFAITTTLKGIGPFIKGNINSSILFLDLFLSVISICTLFFSTILTERQREKKLNKISNNKLQNNETILEAIIESPKEVSIYSISTNYEYLNFNSLHSLNMKEMYNTKIAIGMSMHESIANKAELKEVIAVLDKVFLGESITTIRHFDINDSFWEFKSSPIINQNNEIIGATIISTNITEKLKTEESLRKSEEKYRGIFTNIQDVIFQMDLNGIFLEVSPSIKEFAGYMPEELIGQNSQILEIDEYGADIVFEMIRERKSLINHEKMIKTKSGIIKPISLNAKLIYDKQGNPNHIDAIAQDITERKENEQKIALQNQKLQIQNKELEQFAYITSHDLQEPLLTLKYFSELLKADYPKDNNEDIQQYLNFIIESSDRMQKLVKGLLDYSRIGNQIDISKEDCNEIVNNAIYSLSSIIEKTKASITVDKLPIVSGYSVELIDLFTRLIANSIEYRKTNIPPVINISVKEVGNNWQFAIEDNGIGIEKQNIEKIFIIFKRLNNREEYSGIGISLAICKKIIALHGGDIWAESLFGHGTTIYFTLPKN